MVQIYRYENGAWGQRGQDLLGEQQGDRFGDDLSLSSDGTILAVGAPHHPNTGDHGHVRVFQYVNTNNAWNQLGPDIEGSNDDGRFGYAVSLSGDGITVAIGEIFKRLDSNYFIKAGAVYVYEFLNGNWELKGDIIHGLYHYDEFGDPVSLSKDGQTVASMAGKGDFNGTDSGHVMLHRYVNGEWVQIGKSIGGNTGGGNDGQVAMSGKRIIVGFPEATENNNGEVDVYEQCNSLSPSTSPTTSPTLHPTPSPTRGPSTSPTLNPTTGPSTSPTTSPTTGPSTSPTTSPTNEPPRSPEDDDGGSDEGLGIIIGASVGGVVVVGGVGLYFYMTRGAASVARLTRINLGELIF